MAGRQKHMIRSHRSRRLYGTSTPHPELIIPELEAVKAKTLADRIREALDQVIAGIKNLTDNIRKELEKWQ